MKKQILVLLSLLTLTSQVHGLATGVAIGQSAYEGEPVGVPVGSISSITSVGFVFSPVAGLVLLADSGKTEISESEITALTVKLKANPFSELSTEEVVIFDSVNELLGSDREADLAAKDRVKEILNNN